MVERPLFREYPKYVIIVPPSTIEELKWKEGEELEHEVKDEKLRLSKAEPVTEEEALKESAKYRRRTFRRR